MSSSKKDPRPFRKALILTLVLVFISPIFGVVLSDLVGYHEPLDVVAEALHLRNLTEAVNWTPFLDYTIRGLPAELAYVLSGLLGIGIILVIGIMIRRLVRKNMRQKGLTDRFLKSLAETIDSLRGGTEHAPLNPTVAVFSALILTGTAAFSYSFRIPVLILALCVGLVLLTYSPVWAWAKVLLFIFAWATIVSVPLPLMTTGESLANLSLGLIELKVTREGLYAMIAFVSRVVAAAAVFTSFSFVVGWVGIVRGLEGLRVPRELTLLLDMTTIHIPLFLKETSKMLSARDARIVKKMRFKEVWMTLATVVGDLLIRGYERAWRVEKSIEARRFTRTERPWRTPVNGVGIRDLLLLSFTLFILVLAVMSGA